MELVEFVVFLQWQQFGFVELLEAIADCLKDLRILLPPVIGTQPAEHDAIRQWTILYSIGTSIGAFSIKIIRMISFLLV